MLQARPPRPGLSTAALLAVPLLCSTLVGPAAARAAGAVPEPAPGSACEVATTRSGNLDEAKAIFADVCAGYARLDCDPLEEGGWSCSSDVIGTAAPGVASAPRPAAPTPSATPAPLAPAITTDGACYTRSDAGLGEARDRFARNCGGYALVDCDPDGGAWVCSSEVIGAAAPNVPSRAAPAPTIEPSVAPVAEPSPAPEPPPAPAPAMDIVIVEAPDESLPDESSDPSASVSPTPPAGGPVGLLDAGDLLALHYDNCPDRDDGHALAAGKAVVSRLGVGNVLVVNGTCGNSIRDRFVPASRAVTAAVWGDVLDAHADREGAVRAAAGVWLAALGDGNDVWVAEGGQSDFTADVTRRVAALVPGTDLRRIHVIQHSGGAPQAYNERFTDAANLDFLRSATSYVLVPNGNAGGNGSADLNQQSARFVAIARNGAFASEWAAAFDYLRPDCATRTENCKLDFSDTVELLYLVGDTATRDVDGFAERYLR